MTTNVVLNHTVQFLQVNQTQQLQHSGSVGMMQGVQGVEKPKTEFNKDAGTALWENANYKIQFDEKNSQMFVQNKNTGENYTVWGDPHVSVGHEDKNTGPKHHMNDSHDFDFKKDMRMTLDDGTEIHIKTTPWMRNGEEINGATLASQVMIQDGLSDHAFKLTGLDGNGHTLGDMTAQEMTGLQVSEADRINHREGLQIVENDGAQEGFSLQGANGAFSELGEHHRNNTSQITAMENFLGQHSIPLAGMAEPAMLNTNQNMIMNQLQQFMDMAMNMFTQQMQIPDGASIFQQISTVIQGQTHALGME